MTRSEAATKLVMTQMQIAMFMPVSWLKVNGEGSEYDQALQLAIKALNEEPRKTGHFEYNYEAQEYRCSECGHYTASEFDMEDELFKFNGGIGFALKPPHYCKHCGAYMRGQKNE